MMSGVSKTQNRKKSFFARLHKKHKCEAAMGYRYPEVQRGQKTSAPLQVSDGNSPGRKMHWLFSDFL